MTAQELLERVEAATGPDRELDRDILKALPTPTDGWGSVWPEHITWDSLTLLSPWAAPITASIDAAVALVEKMLPGRDVNLEIGNVGADRVTDAYISGADGYFEEPKTPDAHGYGITPALALCAALLRALAAKDTGQ